MCTEDSIINEGVKTQIKEKMDDEWIENQKMHD